MQEKSCKIKLLRSPRRGKKENKDFVPSYAISNETALDSDLSR